MDGNRNVGKFSPEPDMSGYERVKSKNWAWVARLQLIVAFILILQGTHGAFTFVGWKGSFYGAMAMVVFYWLVSGFHKNIWYEKERLDQSFLSLERKYTTFICDVALGLVEQQDLRRLRNAACGSGRKKC